MAVPGSPLDPRAQGCNLLIREGATLVQNAEDVLEAIRPLASGPFRRARARYARAGPPPTPTRPSARRRRPARPDAGAGRRAGPPVGLAAGDRPDRAARARAGRAARAPCRRQGQPAHERRSRARWSLRRRRHLRPASMLRAVHLRRARIAMRARGGRDPSPNVITAFMWRGAAVDAARLSDHRPRSGPISRRSCRIGVLAPAGRLR